MQKEYFIAGVDEAGVGPLAGPVLAAAVILNPKKKISDLKDCKLLTEKKREELFLVIQEKAIACAVGRAEVHEIDRINILQASLLAMKRAIDALPVKPHHALIDGRNVIKFLSCTMEAIIGGDKTVPAISAASILAKVTRDRIMKELDQQYPGYGFAIHKGYSTKAHLAALTRLGPCAIHRQSFAPVRSVQET